MKKVLLIVVFSFTLLCACTSKFVYNNIDWLVYWYVDDYVELNKDQKRIFDKNLQGWLTWHRASELKKYKSHLQHIQDQLKQGSISSEQWQTHFDLARQHWYRLRDTTSLDLAAMAMKLSDRQIDAMFDELEEKNVKRLEEWRKLSVTERAAENIEGIQDRLQDWIGRLSSAQKEIIVSQASELESNIVDWIAYRRNILRQARLLLLQRNEKDNIAAEFLALMKHPEVYQSQTFIDRSAHNQRVFADLLAQISEGLSAKQMKKLNREIQSLIEDIDDLVDN